MLAAPSELRGAAAGAVHAEADAMIVEDEEGSTLLRRTRRTGRRPEQLAPPRLGSRVVVACLLTDNGHCSVSKSPLQLLLLRLLLLFFRGGLGGASSARRSAARASHSFFFSSYL